MMTSTHPAQLLLLSCWLLAARLTLASPGPVSANPADLAPEVQKEPSFATQTVYGFLDFTTTIGNTVMVFSPQSAADSGKNKVAEPAVNVVIDTKPVTSVETQSTVVIKPSKTETKVEKKASEPPKKISSVVEVQSNPPVTLSSKIEIKSGPSTKVNVIEGISSVVNIASATPIVSSKVEVVSAPPSKAPASKPAKAISKPPEQSVITKVEVITGTSKPKSPVVVSSRVEVYEGPGSSSATPVLSSIVEVHSDDEPAVVFGNNIGEPEYDFLSRQPSEVVEETYKVINLKPSSKFHLKPRPSADAKNRANAHTKRPDSLHPTGLVTKLGGTVVKDGATTVHETSVIGTYISGKYAQVLQSTSHIYNQHKGKISPSPSLRILKTAAPVLGKGKHHHLEPTPAGSINDETALPLEGPFNSQNSIKATRKPTGPGGSFKHRFKNRPREQNIEVEEPEEVPAPTNYKKHKVRPTQSQRINKHNSHRPKYGRTSPELATVSVYSEPATATPSLPTGRKYQSRRQQQKQRASTAVVQDNPGYSRRGYKPRVQASAVEQNSATSTSLYKFKLNRSPGRWQYKTTAKPRVTIRKQNDDEIDNATLGTTPTSFHAPNEAITPQARSDDVDSLVGSESVASIIDDESSTENKIDTPAFPLETINVEISTPADFKDTYYEIATIKSPYTFQVGSVKNTRYVTVTSTFEKVLDNEVEATVAPSGVGPLTENILATSANYEKDNNFLDSSIATLPPLLLASDMETPPLETLTETFSTTQTMLKTHILPAVRRGNDTTSYTLVQTYVITRLVHATKTLPPMEAYHFVPSKTLKEFNSHLDEAGSELHLELEFGDDNDQDDDNRARKVFPPDLDLANIGSDFDLSDVDKSRLPEGHLRSKKAHPPQKPVVNEAVPTPNLSPEQLQQLALLRLFNPAAAQPAQVITTSKPVIRFETVYESHVIPVVNGGNTILSTISKSVGTITKTEYEFGTSTIPSLPPVQPVNPLYPQQPVNPLYPQQPVNPLYPQQQQQYQVTSSPIVQTTVVTQTSSKILKLTFGAKTAYTTIYSTKVVPSLVTTYMTASVAVQPTAAFPGFFPAPYPPYPYVG